MMTIFAITIHKYAPIVTLHSGKICFLIALILFVQGCSNIAMRPSNNIDVVYFNQIEDISALIVVNHDVQRYVHTSRPTEGKLWSARTFDIYVGKPFTDTVYNQVKALIPNTSIGNKKVEGKYDLIIDLRIKNIEFGIIDDSYAELRIALAGLIGAATLAGEETISHAKITVSTEIVGTSDSNIIELYGDGIHATGYYGANEEALAKAMENAISDFARKLTIQIEQFVKIHTS